MAGLREGAACMEADIVKQHAEFVELQEIQYCWHGKCRHTRSVGGGEAKEMLLGLCHSLHLCEFSQKHILSYACVLDFYKCIYCGFPFFFPPSRTMFLRSISVQ